jgi:hypothetical protein
MANIGPPISGRAGRPSLATAATGSTGAAEAFLSALRSNSAARPSRISPCQVALKLSAGGHVRPWRFVADYSCRLCNRERSLKYGKALRLSRGADK